MLEDRLLLTNLVVTSALDPLNTPGTLRYEVNQANQDGVRIADTITFASGLNGSIILLQLGPLELTADASLGIWGSLNSVGGTNPWDHSQRRRRQHFPGR